MPTAAAPTLLDVTIPNAVLWRKRAELFFLENFERAMDEPTPPQTKVGPEDLRDRLGRKASPRNVYRWRNSGMAPRDPEILDALCRWISGRLGLEPPIRPKDAAAAPDASPRSRRLRPAAAKVSERRPH